LVFINTKKGNALENIKKDSPVYTISTTAELLGISIHTLRMYEREGLILPHKKNSGHRLYSQEDIDRINCIRKAINESKISIAGIKTIYSLIPCWKFIDCPMEQREKCQAYTSHSQPCWTFNHRGNACFRNDCKNCIVYKDHAECGKIKQTITQL
jgi:MerR family transcriptional regulator/heat shock protein HspR